MPTSDVNSEKSSHFDTTQWSLVMAAGDGGSTTSRDALAALCQIYWYPLYAYAWRLTSNTHEAQDQTQEFFVQLLEKNIVAAADPARGRFRSFLLTSFKNFLANQWDKAQAKKRGGGRQTLTLDFAAASSRYALESSQSLSPQQLYEKQWVLNLLDEVLDRLRAECEANGKAEQFATLKEFIAGSPADKTHQQAARELGISDGAAKVAAHRLRKRYRDLLREEVARTVTAPDEIDDEIRFLFAALA